MTRCRVRGTCICLAGALIWSAAIGTAQTQTDLAGTWGSNIGLTYTITQSGTQYGWQDQAGVRGTITFTATGLTTTWTDASGVHTAEGVIAAKDAQGRPTRITWSNGVVFERAATASGMATLTHVIPVAPSSIPTTSNPPAPPPQPPSAPPTPCQPPPVPFSLPASGSELPPQGLVLALRMSTITGNLPGGAVRIYGADFSSISGTPKAAGGSALSGASPSIAPLAIRKNFDFSSPALMHAHFKGTVLPDASVLVIDPGAARVLAEWHFDSVSVVSHRASLESASGPSVSAHVEQIALQFERFKFRVYAYDEKTGFARCVEIGYDLKQTSIW